jgi:hypothetical protein
MEGVLDARKLYKEAIMRARRQSDVIQFMMNSDARKKA